MGKIPWRDILKAWEPLLPESSSIGILMTSNEKYGLKDLKNTGRYYIARLVEKDGTVIDEVLIDKQSGTIQSLRGRIGAGG